MKKERWYDGKAVGCPVCRSRRTRVVETRDHDGATYRRRVCAKDHSFSTVEMGVVCEGGLHAAALVVGQGAKVADD